MPLCVRRARSAERWPCSCSCSVKLTEAPSLPSTQLTRAQRERLLSSCNLFLSKVVQELRPTNCSRFQPRPRCSLASLLALALALARSLSFSFSDSAIAQTHLLARTACTVVHSVCVSSCSSVYLTDLLLVSLTWCYTLSQDLVFVLFVSRVFLARSVLLFATYTCACNSFLSFRESGRSLAVRACRLCETTHKDWRT